MTPASPSISDMINQSRKVLTQPSVESFEEFEDAGGLREALIYVAISAGLTGVFGLFNGFGSFIQGIVTTLLGFLIFTFLVYWAGKQQGGTGTLDQVAYTFSLFWAPLAVLFAGITLILFITIIGIVLVPLLGIAALAINIFLAYLAVQSSMNLQSRGQTWMTLLLAGVGTFIAQLIIGAIIS